jgi:hypothetical protein
MGTFSSKG